MDALGLPFALALIGAWLVIGLIASLIFGKAAHRTERNEGDSELEAWVAQREERVRRAEFRHATRHGRTP